MKVREVRNGLKEQGYLDEEEIFAYGRESNYGMFGGAARNSCLICVERQRVTMFASNIHNEAVKVLFAAPAGSLAEVTYRLGFLGLQRKISFRYNAVPYKFITPVGARKFNRFFKELSKKKSI